MIIPVDMSMPKEKVEPDKKSNEVNTFKTQLTLTKPQDNIDNKEKEQIVNDVDAIVNGTDSWILFLKA